MRASYEVVRLSDACSLKCMSTEGRRFGHRWHFHPEFELSLVEHSRGLRFVGTGVAPYREGDLILIGPNLPHAWITDGRNNPLGHARSIFVQFRKDIGGSLWDAPEFSHVAALLERSRHGVHFVGPNARKAAEHMRQLSKTTGAPRILHLLSILHLLARSRRQTLLSKDGYVPKLNGIEAARINIVCSYVEKHLTEEISQPAAAALARMHPATFSLFFRKKVGSTFSAYVNQLRVAHAIHLMVEEKRNISEACFASGFNNLSNFNFQFRAIKGMSPRAFLRRFTADLVATA